MSGASPDEPRSPGGEFRPELEGLRAVAVGLVLLYHANVPTLGGGYVGVDVFFVLSGFLITGLITRELRSTGRIDLPRFYARRARRLLPAAAVAIAGTLLLSALLLPPLRVPDVTGDAAAASLYVSNIRFAAQATDYLSSDLAPSPLLHFWSLGVEGPGGRERVLTVEVDPSSREIIQAKARCNEEPNEVSRAIVLAWAGCEGLRLRS